MLTDGDMPLPCPASQAALTRLPEPEQAFFVFFLALAKTLLQQGRVPVFDDIAVKALEPRDPDQPVYFLDLATQQI